MRVSRFAAAAFVVLLASGCSSLPSQGPIASQIQQDASPDPAHPNYMLVNLSEPVVSTLEKWPSPTFYGHMGDYRPPPSPVIGVGDSVSVTIWEAAAGGLFSSGAISGITAGSHSAVIPDQVVDRDGSITVPYANRIQAAGFTPTQVEQSIIKNLQGKAIEPQALVTVSRDISNTATVTGEVAAGARVPLSPRGDRIMDVIASAGGVRAPVNETFIALTRKDTTITVPMQLLLDHPQQNIFVRPNDILTLVRDPQTFSVFGATGRNAVVNFDALGISLEEAVAKAGGLLDLQADAQGVFLLRAEPAQIVHELNPAFPIAAGQRFVNVIYQADMSNANTYFLARRFAIRNKDILYVASAQTIGLQKVLALVGAIATPAAEAISVCNSRC